MIRFKEFIAEVYLNNIKKGRKLGLGGYMGAHINSKHAFYEKPEHIGTLKNGHHVYREKQGETSQNYHVVDPKTKRINISLATSTQKTGSNAESIDGVVSNKRSNGLHHLYHHLVLNHDKVLSSDSQSEGARKVWQKAAKHPDIHVHGYDSSTGKLLHLHPDDDEGYASNAEKRGYHRDAFAAHDRGDHTEADKIHADVAHIDHIKDHISIVMHKKDKSK